MGAGLRRSTLLDGPRRSHRGPRTQCSRSRLLRDARRCKPLLDPPSRPDREDPRDARRAHRTLRRHVRAGRDVSSAASEGRLASRDEAAKSSSNQEIGHSRRFNDRKLARICGNSTSCAFTASSFDGNSTSRAFPASNFDGNSTSSAFTASSFDGNSTTRAFAASNFDGKSTTRAFAASNLDGNATTRAFTASNFDGNATTRAFAASDFDGNATTRAFMASNSRAQGSPRRGVPDIPSARFWVASRQLACASAGVAQGSAVPFPGTPRRVLPRVAGTPRRVLPRVAGAGRGTRGIQGEVLAPPRRPVSAVPAGPWRFPPPIPRRAKTGRLSALCRIAPGSDARRLRGMP